MTMRGKFKERPERTGDFYNTPDKIHIRQLIVDNAPTNVNKIITFPGTRGYCVQKFNEAWPTARIIGLEDTDIRAGLCMPTKIVDGKEIRFEIPQLEWKHTSFEKWASNTLERNFDVGFLDFKGWFDGYKSYGTRAKQSVKFIDELTAPYAIVAITFCPSNKHIKNKSKPEELKNIITYFQENCKRPIKLVYDDNYDVAEKGKGKAGMYIVIFHVFPIGVENV